MAKSKTNNKSLVLIAAAAAVLIFSVKKHFFFDEDIFITNINSLFMQQDWQRSVFAKQLFKAQHFLFGTTPAGYHVVSVLLHLFNSITGYQLLKKLKQYFNITDVDGNAAVIIFLIFFLFTPVHSEPVSYILAQGVLLFSLLAQYSILFFIKAEAGYRYYYISLLFFALCLLCYEISWMLPVMFFTLLLFSKVTIANSFKKVLPFFSILIAWLGFKYFFIEKSLIADYGNVSLSNINFLQFFRNGLILFIRNFTSPFSNTVVFVIVAVCVCIILLLILYKAYKLNKTVLKFLLLLLFLTALSVVPACLFGIDSHDTESERYVYFSSVFAMMFLAVAVSSVIKRVAVKKVVTAIISMAFILQLFSSINDYRLAGNFSKSYTSLLAAEVKGVQKVFLINQPSQYKGALMLRALTRLPHLTQQHHTVLNEYMQYLYKNVETEFITVSKKEMAQPFLLLKSSVKPFDSTGVYFNEAKPLIQSVVFEKGKTIIAALRNDTLFIFR